MSETTFCGRVGVAEANTMKEQKTQAERNALKEEGLKAIQEVRHFVKRRFDNGEYQGHHRDIVRNILSL